MLKAVLIENFLKKKHIDDSHPKYIVEHSFCQEKKEISDAGLLRSYGVRLKEIEHLKNEFILAVSHELRTPLTSIRALAEIICHTPELEPGKHQKFTRIIIKETERLSRLINNILDLKKIKNRQIEWKNERIDFKKIIESSILSIDQLIDGKNIELILELSKASVFVSGDKDYLKQAMVNLITNAIKFCDRDNGKIKIGMEVGKQGDNGNRQLTVFVEDNGIGIGKDDQGFIFLEFRQVISRTKGRPGGIGLGLTIAKQIIDSHGGKIWVESELDKGATFFITIPLI